MRIFIASDTHGRAGPTKILMERIEAFKPDRILFLGDFNYNGPRNGVPEDYDPMGTAKQFASLRGIALGVRGNCDSRVDEMLMGIPLKDWVDLELNGRKVHLTHGDLPLPKERMSAGDLLFYGHTHVYEIAKRDDVLYLNPGSPSFPKNGNPPSYATWAGNRLSVIELKEGKILASYDLK